MRKKIKEPTTDKSEHVVQRTTVHTNLKIREYTWTENQQHFIDTVRKKDSKIIFLKGPAGSAKTLASMSAGLHLLNEPSPRIKEIACVRSLVESGAFGMGYLPGEEADKVAPYAQPFLEKMRGLLSPSEIVKLTKPSKSGQDVVEPVVQFLPVNFLRGREFNASFIVVSESQNFCLEELQTILTRFGKFSKMVIEGDTEQSDLETFRNRRSGFKYMFESYDKPEHQAKGIYCIKFGLEDIKREPIISHIVETYHQIRKEFYDIRADQN